MWLIELNYAFYHSQLSRKSPSSCTNSFHQRDNNFVHIAKYNVVSPIHNRFQPNWAWLTSPVVRGSVAVAKHIASAIKRFITLRHTTFMPFGTLRKISNLSERSDHGNQHFICADDVLWWLVGFTQPLTPTSNVKQLAKPSLSMSCSRVVTMAKVIWKCTHAERRFGREWPLFCVDAVKSHQRCYVYIQLSPLVSGMVRESLKSSLQRSCCGEVRCEKEKNFCVDNFSELAQLLDFCSTRTRFPIYKNKF